MSITNSFDYLYLCSLISFFSHMKVLLYCSHFVAFHLSLVKHVAIVPDISCNGECFFHHSPIYVIFIHGSNTLLQYKKKIKTP